MQITVLDVDTPHTPLFWHGFVAHGLIVVVVAIAKKKARTVDVKLTTNLDMLLLLELIDHNFYHPKDMSTSSCNQY